MGRNNQRTGRQMVGCVRLLQARRSRNWAEVSESDDGVALAAIYDRRSNERWSGSPSGSHTPFGNLIRLLKFCFICDFCRLNRTRIVSLRQVQEETEFQQLRRPQTEFGNV